MWFLIGVMAILTIAFIITSLKPDAEVPEIPRQADFTKWTVHIDANQSMYGVTHHSMRIAPLFMSLIMMI